MGFLCYNPIETVKLETIWYKVLGASYGDHGVMVAYSRFNKILWSIRSVTLLQLVVVSAAIVNRWFKHGYSAIFCVQLRPAYSG